jgi:hypothetical protein
MYKEKKKFVNFVKIKMEEINLENIDVDELYNLFIEHRIPPVVAQRFKDNFYKKKIKKNIYIFFFRSNV